MNHFTVMSLLIACLLLIAESQAQQMLLGTRPAYHTSTVGVYPYPYPTAQSILSIKPCRMVQPRADVIVWTPYSDEMVLFVSKYDPQSMMVIGDQFNVSFAAPKPGCQVAFTQFPILTVPNFPSLVVIAFSCDRVLNQTDALLIVNIDTLQQTPLLIPHATKSPSTEIPLAMVDDRHALYTARQYMEPNILLLRDLYDGGRIVSDWVYVTTTASINAARVTRTKDVIVEVEDGYGANSRLDRGKVDSNFNIKNVGRWRDISTGRSNIDSLQIDKDNNVYVLWYDRASTMNNVWVMPNNATLKWSMWKMFNGAQPFIATPTN